MHLRIMRLRLFVALVRTRIRCWGQERRIRELQQQHQRLKTHDEVIARVNEIVHEARIKLAERSKTPYRGDQ